MSYDVKCLELAAQFLSDFEVPDDELPGHTDRLAQDIQNAIKDYFLVAELKERS